MRLAVFVFALTLIFSTTFAHAVAFVPVVNALGSLWAFGGKVVKVASSRTMLTTVGAVGMIGYQPAVAYCKKNPKKCKDILGDASEFFFEDDEDTVKGCVGVIYFIGSNNNKSTNLNDVVSAEIDKEINDARKYYPTTQYVSHSQDFSDLIAEAQRSIDEQVKRQVKSTNKNISTYRKQQFIDTTVTFGNSTINRKVGYSIAVQADYLCDDDMPDDKKAEIKIEKEQIKKEQAQKVVQNLSDDDITYIINNYGDQINVGQYCSDNSCDELELSFAEEVKKNQDKYDIDKINSQNCTVKNKKIVSCKKAHKDQLEFDFDSEPEEPQPSDETPPKKEDEDPTICDTSDITREICEYLDWVDDEAEEPTDTKVDIEDPEESGLDEEMINIMKECPADMQFTITMLGKSMTFKLSTMPFCLVAEKIRPYLISAGSLSALFILAGIKRD